jgi:hypothetical protein
MSFASAEDELHEGFAVSPDAQRSGPGGGGAG